MSVPDINAMVDRFLAWKLPAGFAPDCGIKFDAMCKVLVDGEVVITARTGPWWPTGTNLFTADQARAMFEYVLAFTAPAKTGDE